MDPKTGPEKPDTAEKDNNAERKETLEVHVAARANLSEEIAQELFIDDASDEIA